MSVLAIDKRLQDYWHTLENRAPIAAIDLTLARIQPLVDRLGLSTWDCPIITVAGTNGKGSVVATCQALAKAAGIRLGAYTSPHLHHFNERFQRDGQAISDEALLQALLAIDEARGDIPLTHFEQLTLAALWFFKQQATDGLVLEVGLGGEHDAVNCVAADVSVFTSIHYDHQQWLGPTLSDIARAKAGILRPHQQAVVGCHAAHPTLLEKIRTIGAVLHQEGVHFSALGASQVASLPKWLEPHNANIAIKAMQLAWPDQINNTIITSALSQVTLPGRLEILQFGPLIIADVAHNEQSALRLNEFCRLHPVTGKRHVLWSSLQDKDMATIVRAMAAETDEWWIAPCTDAYNPRAASLEQLAAVLAAQGCIYHAYQTRQLAFEAAKQSLQPTDRLVVFGNFEWVGSFRIDGKTT